MPTIFSHGTVGFCASKLIAGAGRVSPQVTLGAVATAMLPDADVLLMGTIPYSHPLGHRGMTHSLVFAAVTGCALALWYVRAGWNGGLGWRLLAAFFTLVTASHGFFDAMTNGGLGVAFFWPFDHSRYFLPWRPIPVSPLSAVALLSPRGLRVIGWELGLFWTFAAGAAVWERRSRWRTVAAVACFAAGLAIWVWAIARNL